MFIKKNITVSDKKKKLDLLSDYNLLEEYKRMHDPACIGELFTRYTHLVYGVCLKYLKNPIEAEDAVMQIFEELFVKLQQHNIENFNSWLYSVSKNYCLMQIRKYGTFKKSFDAFCEKNKNDIVELIPELHHNNEKTDIIHKLLEALNTLVEEQKQCLKLMYLENKSYKEVAILTGYTIKQVKSYIQNGKRNLKKNMEKDYAEE